MLFTCGAGGNLHRWYNVYVVHMVLVYMWYYVHVYMRCCGHAVVIGSLCSRGILTCVFPMLSFM